MARRLAVAAFVVVVAAACGSSGSSKSGTPETKKSTTTTAARSSGSSTTTTAARTGSSGNKACDAITAEELHSLSPDAPATGKDYAASSLGPGAVGCQWFVSNTATAVYLSMNRPGAALAKALVAKDNTGIFKPYPGVGEVAGLFEQPSEHALAIEAAQGDVVITLSVDRAPGMTADKVASVARAILGRLAG
jgi:hypothetical protein